MSVLVCCSERKEGFTLVEVVIAVAIVLVAIMAVIQATTMSLKSSRFARDKAQATKYAQQGIELLVSERDTNWTNLLLHANSTCTAQLSCFTSQSVWTVGASCNANLEGKYTRQVTLTGTGTDCSNPDYVTAVVTVTWENIHTSELTTILRKK